MLQEPDLETCVFHNVLSGYPVVLGVLDPVPTLQGQTALPRTSCRAG